MSELAQAQIEAQQPTTAVQLRRGRNVLSIPVDSTNILSRVIVSLRETIIKDVEVRQKLTDTYIGLTYTDNVRSITYLADVIANNFFMLNTEISSLIVPPRLVEYSFKTRLLTLLNTASMSLRDVIKTLVSDINAYLNTYDLEIQKELLRKLENFIILLLAVHIAILVDSERILGLLAVNLGPLDRPAVANMLFTERDISVVG
ncbi:MAG: hypothetical protein QXX12_00690 [Nanopusillaceae archaeon]